MIVLRHFAKTLQSPCHISYQCQRALDKLLPSSRLLTNQTLAKAAVVD